MIHYLYIPTSRADRETDALIEQSRNQRERGLIFSQQQIDEAERAKLEEEKQMARL